MQKLCEFEALYRVARENLYTFFKVLPIFAIIYTTEMCNTALEREFCRLFWDFLKNGEKCSYEVVLAFIWQVAEMAKKPIY